MTTGVLLIVDDNPAVCGAVRAYMSRIGGWEVVLTAFDAETALRLSIEHDPEAIVLDNRMPDGNGIDVLADLRASCPTARIIMHTSEDTIDVRDAAQRLGADAVVAKGRPLGELAGILHAA